MSYSRPVLPLLRKLGKEIQAYVKKTIAAINIRGGIEFVKDLPKTATGKIQRFKLRA